MFPHIFDNSSKIIFSEALYCAGLNGQHQLLASPKTTQVGILGVIQLWQITCRRRTGVIVDTDRRAHRSQEGTFGTAASSWVGRGMPCQHSGYRLPTLRTMRKNNFCCFWLPVKALSLGHPSKWIQTNNSPPGAFKTKTSKKFCQNSQS